MKVATRVLLVEDDQSLREVIETNIRNLGFEVSAVGTIAGGHQVLEKYRFMAAILDRNLPDGEGLELCKFIRTHMPAVPVIMLTSMGDEIERVVGLEVGADDYVTKPFSMRELMARIKACVRRSQIVGGQSSEGLLVRGDLIIDPANRRATLRGKDLELTTRELDVLLLLARHPGKTFSRMLLLQEAWGYEFEGYEHTVNTHINRLRSKLGDSSSDPKYIHTVWGVGYRFSESL